MSVIRDYGLQRCEHGMFTYASSVALKLLLEARPELPETDPLRLSDAKAQALHQDFKVTSELTSTSAVSYSCIAVALGEAGGNSRPEAMAEPLAEPTMSWRN